VIWDGDRVAIRRIDLDASDDGRMLGVLPHELTHVVLQSASPMTPPHWASEGIAIQAEPPAKQTLRRLELKELIRAHGRLQLGQILSDENWSKAPRPSLLYSQSASLVEFLLTRGCEEDLMQFIHASRDRGVEASLMEVYAISSADDLHAKWLEFAMGGEPLAAAR
jgi:hypothetical protein